MPTPRGPFSRVLLKLSGEAFSGEGGFGVESGRLRSVAGEIIAARERGSEIAVVIGGGNIIRGAHLAREGVVHRATADQMGMLGTVINGLALREILVDMGQDARCMTAVEIPAVAEPFIRLRAVRHMELGRVVVLAGGIGIPFFTTDTTAALRASELDCQAVLKGTKVDGVYDDDPIKNPNATRFDSLTYTDVLQHDYKVMDAAAISLCRENEILAALQK